MKNKVINIDKLQEDILELMVDSGLPEDNAYNWGLQHATLLIQGVKPQDIVDVRMRMTMGIAE